MRRILFSAAILALLATPALAQGPMGFELGLGGGVNVPIGNWGDVNNTGYAVNASIGYKVSPMFIVGADFGFYGNGATDEVIAALGSGADASNSIIQFAGMGKLMLPMATHNAYGKAVLGGYRASSRVEGTVLGDFEVSDTRFGFGLGGGLQFNTPGNSSFFVEGMYHKVDGVTQDADFFSISGGVLFSLR